MPTQEVVLSVEKVKRAPGATIIIIGNPCGSVSRDKAEAGCPDCRVKIRFPEADVKRLWHLYAEWSREGAYLQGIFDCPNSECERPFALTLFSEKDAEIGWLGFYERENTVTLKAKREPSRGSEE